MFAGLYSVDGLDLIGSVRDFDEMITARFCGFTSADDYYARSSAMHVLAAIAIPTLILPRRTIPSCRFQLSSGKPFAKTPTFIWLRRSMAAIADSSPRRAERSDSGPRPACRILRSPLDGRVVTGKLDLVQSLYGFDREVVQTDPPCATYSVICLRMRGSQNF